MPWSLAVNDAKDAAAKISPASDKFTSHSYQTMYGTFLGPLRTANFTPKLLEIGLGCDMKYGPGASVKFWQAFLPRLELWESDFDEACVNKSRSLGLLDGVHTLVGDQGSADTVKQWVLSSGGNFDVIIDDGGHRNTQIKTSFDILWPTLKPGGLYFLEDLQLGRHPGWDDTEGAMVMSDVIQSWVEQLLIAKSSDSEAALTADPTLLQWPLPDAVDFVFCQAEACVVGKSPMGNLSDSRERMQQTRNNDTIDMCSVQPNERPTLCETEAPWDKDQLLASLHAFSQVYAQRPWKLNGGGMGVNHAFALWYTVRWLRPTHIVESGVWAGQSTWLMRKAAPDAWIFSFDPDDSHLAYNDSASGQTRYFIGNQFIDIGQVQWDKLIAHEHRAKTLIMLDDHQSVMARVPQLLRNGFIHVWYDDNAKYNDKCYNFAWLCAPLPKGTDRVMVEASWGQEAADVSVQEHNANVDFLQQHLDTYYTFPAIFDGCASDNSNSLLSSAELLDRWGLPPVGQETYNYWHGDPPYVRLQPVGKPEHQGVRETPLIKNLLPAERRMLFGTVSNSLSHPNRSFASYLVSYVEQNARPHPLERETFAHTYWHGSFGRKPALAVKSFLATQDMKQLRVIVWLDARTPNITNELRALQLHGVEVRLFDYSQEAAGTPLAGMRTDVAYAGHEDWPVDRTAADLVRYVVLYNHGGIWFDADVLFLRNLSPLLRYEFAYPWSKYPPHGRPENHTLNGAVMRFFKGSDALLDLARRVASERIPFGLWGLSALRDNSRHPDLSVVDVEFLDPMWKHESYFPEGTSLLLRDEPYPESTRFDWFFDASANRRRAGLVVLESSQAFTYHWHNHWDHAVHPGSAFSLYENLFDCALAEWCVTTLEMLQR